MDNKMIDRMRELVDVFAKFFAVHMFDHIMDIAHNATTTNEPPPTENRHCSHCPLKGDPFMGTRKRNREFDGGDDDMVEALKRPRTDEHECLFTTSDDGNDIDIEETRREDDIMNLFSEENNNDFEGLLDSHAK